MRVNVYFPEDDLKRIDATAKLQGVSRSEMLRKMVQFYLDHKPKPKTKPKPSIRELLRRQ